MSRVAAEALSYQSEIVQVREEPLPRLLRAWPALGAVVLIGLVTMAGLLPVDVVVSARGQIVSNEPPAILRPIASAVLHSLLVQAGDVVVKGQLLAKLDAGVPEANIAILETERAAVAAEIARVEAYLAGRALEGAGPEFDLQRQVQVEQAAMETAQRDSLKADLAGLDGEAAAVMAEEPALEERVSAARELEEIRATLLSDQNGTRVAFVEARLARLAAEGQLREHKARLEAMRKQREAAAARLLAFDSDLRQRRLEQLAELRPKIAVVEEQLAQATNLTQMYDILVPKDGVILSVAPGGPGSILTPADPVAIIAPTGGPMHVEIGLGSDDVGKVQVGDQVQIKVDAFPWRRHGFVSGRLVSIAPSSKVPPTGGEAVHTAHVALDPGAAAPPGLMPGMTLTTDVMTGTSTILQFFLGPLLDGLSESLREPRP